MELTSLITEKFKLAENQQKALKKLRLKTIEDLLYHFPVRYGDIASIRHVKEIKAGDHVALYGVLSNLSLGKSFKKKTAMAKATLTDDTGSIEMVWFHQPYIAKMLTDNTLVRAEGVITDRKGVLYMTNPETEVVKDAPLKVGNSIFGNPENQIAYPVYAESRGITSKWFYHALQKILKSGLHEKIVDPIPPLVLKKYNLPTLSSSLVWIHTPQKESDRIAARKRFAFEEIFLIQIEKHQERLEYQKHPSFVVEKEDKEIEGFIKRFPFIATQAQQKAIKDILEDFKEDHAMSRLLEGDVGSGKTAVAAATVFAITTTRPPKAQGKNEQQNFGNLQTAYMAPTEILAEQHFESFIQYFAYLGIQIGLITGSGCKKFPSKLSPTKATDISRSQLLKWVENGEIPILVGTHALIQKEVKFKNLAYIIIDEQHRFGTKQRAKLRQKEDAILPHLLSMTATPIPRTL
ncbi:MAG: ATP-dependent helicase RecG, ATP-dependent helicase RecG, partial [Candidatus Parcubacteria bacterium]